MGFSSRIGQSRANSLLIKSLVVLSIAKYWAAKPQMAQYVVSPMRRRHFVNGLIGPQVIPDRVSVPVHTREEILHPVRCRVPAASAPPGRSAVRSAPPRR